MSFWNWFKPKNKTNVVLPTSDNTRLLHGHELLKAFTTDTEPKVADYPKGKYTAHWETVIGTVDGGYSAIVRFYGNQGSGLLKEVVVLQPTVDALKAEVDTLIRRTMEQYKR